MTTRAYIKSLSVPIGIYVILAVLVYTRLFETRSFFFEAVSIDLIISAPLFYWLAARRFKTRTLLVFPLMALGFSLSKFLLPSETMTMQWLGRFLLPVLELVTIGSLSYYAYGFYQAARKSEETDALDIIRQSCTKVIGSSLVSKILTTEFSVMYYALVAWRGKHRSGFTVYKDTGVLTIYGFLIFIIWAETLILHLLLIRWNEWVAWLAFASSGYVALQIFAHAKAMKFRQVVTGSSLKIRYGLAGNVEVPFSHIQRVLVCTDYKMPDRKPVHIGLLKNFEPYSVAIELTGEVEVETFYGRIKAGDTLLLPVDSPNEFKRVIDARLNRDRH